MMQYCVMYYDVIRVSNAVKNDELSHTLVNVGMTAFHGKSYSDWMTIAVAHAVNDLQL